MNLPKPRVTPMKPFRSEVLWGPMKPFRSEVLWGPMKPFRSEVLWGIAEAVVGAGTLLAAMIGIAWLLVRGGLFG